MFCVGKNTQSFQRTRDIFLHCGVLYTVTIVTDYLQRLRRKWMENNKCPLCVTCACPVPHQFSVDT